MSEEFRQCERCKKMKDHLIAIDLDWTLLSYVCNTCLNEMHFEHDPVCPHCGKSTYIPFDDSEEA